MNEFLLAGKMVEKVPILGDLAKGSKGKETERGLFDLGKLTETLGQLGKASHSSRYVIRVGKSITSSQAKWQKLYQA